MLKKQGFGLLEVMMVMVILSILYSYASNSGAAKYKSSKDIAEINWLTNHLPNSLFMAIQRGGRAPSGDMVLKPNVITKPQLEAGALGTKTGAGREWEICSIPPTDPTHLCIRITGSKIDSLKTLIEDNGYAYIPNSSLSKISDTELEVIYDFP